MRDFDGDGTAYTYGCNKEMDWEGGDTCYVSNPQYTSTNEPDCSAVCNPEFTATQLDIIVELIQNQLGNVTQLQKQLYTLLAKAEIQAEIKREKEMDDGCN